MNSADDVRTLAGEFEPATRSQWMDLVTAVLTKGTTGSFAAAEAGLFERRLVTRMMDGLSVQPLYTAADRPEAGPGDAPARHGRAGGRWDIRVRAEVDDDGRVDTGAVLEALGTGATSILLGLRVAPAIDADVLDRAFDGVYLDLAPVVLDAGDRVEEAVAALAALWSRRGVDPAIVAGGFGADPLGEHARTGGSVALEPGLRGAARLARRCVETHPGVRALVVDSTPYHEAGGSAAFELGCSLATGVAYLRALTDAGLPVDAAAGQIEFRLAAGAEQFTTIAALRAARQCWARVTSVAGTTTPGARQHQHVVTSAAMTARYDPWVNLLRTTVAAFAAGIGGADSITVTPHDALVVPGGSEPGRRMARNVSNILMDESNLARVADPAGGSFYVERLTAEVAAAAWDWFTEIEAAGGMAAALEAGLVGSRVDGQWAERVRRVSRRQDALTGVSEFPNVDEPVPPAAPTSVSDPARAAAATPAAPATGQPEAAFRPLTPRRYAEPFEAQRGRADRLTEARGERPAVFLATLGPLAGHAARTGFAQNLFAAGGVRAVPGPPDGFAAAGTPLACICSSDAVYAEEAGAVATALKAAGARRVYLAGRPADEDRRSAYAAAGVDEFLFAGGDAVEVLRDALDVLGWGPSTTGAEVQ